MYSDICDERTYLANSKFHFLHTNLHLNIPVMRDIYIREGYFLQIYEGRIFFTDLTVLYCTCILKLKLNLLCLFVLYKPKYLGVKD